MAAGDPVRADIAVPLDFDERGRTGSPGDAAEHVRDMIELLLFTSPSERVNRPDFGSGLLQMVFAPASPELAATIEYTTHGALQRWLADVIEVHGLAVTVEGAVLRVDLEYSVLRTRERRRDGFEREVVG